MLLSYCDNNEANAASKLSENIQNLAGGPGSEQSVMRPKNRSSRESQSERSQKSECFAQSVVTAWHSEKADRWVLEYVSLCTCGLSEATFKSLFEFATPRHSVS